MTQHEKRLAAVRLVHELVGPPTAKEIVTLFGRMSETRLLAREQGLERYLPAPPPIEDDLSLKYARAEAVIRTRRRLGLSTNNRTGPVGEARRVLESMRKRPRRR